MIDIILPVYNNLEITKNFIVSLKRQEIEYNLIIIDNGSDKKCNEFLQSLENTIIIRNSKNEGYIKAVNQGFEKIKSEIVIIMNNDIILPKKLLKSILKKNISGICSVYSNNINPKKSNEILIEFPYEKPSLENIDRFHNKLQKENYNLKKEVDFVYGHFMILKKEVIEKIGKLDEIYGEGNYEDIDYCYRARGNNFKVELLMDCFVYHHCHSTFKNVGIDIDKLIRINQNKFLEKWR